MREIKFILNILKTIWEHRFLIGEIRIWEFDKKGNLKSVTTNWYDLK